eukprot:4079176-Pyramimonas_sp.AAC.1
MVRSVLAMREEWRPKWAAVRARRVRCCQVAAARYARQGSLAEAAAILRAAAKELRPGLGEIPEVTEIC